MNGTRLPDNLFEFGLKPVPAPAARKSGGDFAAQFLALLFERTETQPSPSIRRAGRAEESGPSRDQTAAIAGSHPVPPIAALSSSSAARILEGHHIDPHSSNPASVPLESMPSPAKNGAQTGPEVGAPASSGMRPVTRLNPVSNGGIAGSPVAQIDTASVPDSRPDFRAVHRASGTEPLAVAKGSPNPAPTATADLGSRLPFTTPIVEQTADSSRRHGAPGLPDSAEGNRSSRSQAAGSAGPALPALDRRVAAAQSTSGTISGKPLQAPVAVEQGREAASDRSLLGDPTVAESRRTAGTGSVAQRFAIPPAVPPVGGTAEAQNTSSTNTDGRRQPATLRLSPHGTSSQAVSAEPAARLEPQSARPASRAEANYEDPAATRRLDVTPSSKSGSSTGSAESSPLTRTEREETWSGPPLRPLSPGGSIPVGGLEGSTRQPFAVAGTAPRSAAPTLETPQALFEQLVERFRLEQTPGSTRFSVQLRPEHLGRVEIETVQDGDVLTAVIRVEDGRTRAVLESALDGLMERLEEAGIHVQRAEVTDFREENNPQGGQRGAGSGQRNRRAQDPVRQDPAEDAPTGSTDENNDEIGGLSYFA